MLGRLPRSIVRLDVEAGSCDRGGGRVRMRHRFSVHGNEFAAGGTNRREFIKTITMAAASVGLTSSAATRIAEAAARGLKPSVVWLHFPPDVSSRPRRADPGPDLSRL